MRKNVPEETLEKIVTDKLFFKLGTKDIAEKHNLSRAFVDATVAAYKQVTAANWEKVKFMLDGGQVNIKVVEWAAKKCGVEVPASIYAPKPEPKEEPKPEFKPETNPVLQPLAGQTSLPEFNEICLQFSKGENNTIHALIDALNRNADETAQLRKAIFGLLHSAGCAE